MVAAIKIHIRASPCFHRVLPLQFGSYHQYSDQNRSIVQAQGRNIRTYDEYLVQRAVSYEATKVDSVRTANDGRLKRLNIEKGLLREVEAVQSQIKALVRCDVS